MAVAWSSSPLSRRLRRQGRSRSPRSRPLGQKGLPLPVACCHGLGTRQRQRPIGAPFARRRRGEHGHQGAHGREARSATSAECGASVPSAVRSVAASSLPGRKANGTHPEAMRSHTHERNRKATGEESPHLVPSSSTVSTPVRRGDGAPPTRSSLSRGGVRSFRRGGARPCHRTAACSHVVGDGNTERVGDIDGISRCRHPTRPQCWIPRGASFREFVRQHPVRPGRRPDPSQLSARTQ